MCAHSGAAAGNGNQGSNNQQGGCRSVSCQRKMQLSTQLALPAVLRRVAPVLLRARTIYVGEPLCTDAAGILQHTGLDTTGQVFVFKLPA